jgi:hypothetical protein
MKTTATIFQPSDFNQRGRAILDAAREGWARLRDKDGFSLVILPEERMHELWATVRSIAHQCGIEPWLTDALVLSAEAHEPGEWIWPQLFDCKPTAWIYQPSDLNQRGRTILDAAREGCARLRDKDGLSLIMLPEERVGILWVVARVIANLCTVKCAITDATGRTPDLNELGEWTWLRVFDREDLEEFVSEMSEALLVAAREETADLIDETLHRWRTTAKALDDPLRREVLLGSPRDEDFVEVKRPE